MTEMTNVITTVIAAANAHVPSMPLNGGADLLRNRRITDHVITTAQGMKRRVKSERRRLTNSLRTSRFPWTKVELANDRRSAGRRKKNLTSKTEPTDGSVASHGSSLRLYPQKSQLPNKFGHFSTQAIPSTNQHRKKSHPETLKLALLHFPSSRHIEWPCIENQTYVPSKQRR